MEIEKLEFKRVGKILEGSRVSVMMGDIEIGLNIKVIKTWIAGMNQIEKESFYKLLSEALEPDEDGKELLEAGQVILDYLNRITGKKIRARNSKGNITIHFKLILDRLKDNATIEECCAVIDRKSKTRWFIQNPHLMVPSTLFRASNFEKYRNEI